MPSAAVREVNTFVGSRNTGKSTSVRAMADPYLEDVLVYSTPGDKTFNSYMRKLPSVKVYLEALALINQIRYQPLRPGGFTPLFKFDPNDKISYPEPVALLIAGEIIAGYVSGFTQDKKSAIVLVNTPADQIVLGKGAGQVVLQLPPNRTLEQRLALSPVLVPLHVVQRCKRLLKVQLPKDRVPFRSASPKEDTMSTLFKHLTNCLFIISDASSLLAMDRVYNRDLHDIVTECRHQGVDLFLIVHKLENLHEEQFTQSNSIVFHKQDVRTKIPTHIRDLLSDDKRNELEKLLLRVEGHPLRHYSEAFINFPAGEAVEYDGPLL